MFLKLIFTQSNFAYIGISYLLMILLVKRNNLAIFSGIDSFGKMCFLKCVAVKIGIFSWLQDHLIYLIFVAYKDDHSQSYRLSC